MMSSPHDNTVQWLKQYQALFFCYLNPFDSVSPCGKAVLMLLTYFDAVLKVNLFFVKHLANIKCYINLKCYYPQDALICRVWSYCLDFFFP